MASKNIPLFRLMVAGILNNAVKGEIIAIYFFSNKKSNLAEHPFFKSRRIFAGQCAK
jgi:hypothetical protein